MATPSNNYKPFLAYLSQTEYARMKKFASKNRVTMTQVVREAITARIASGNPYVAGFNDGLQKAIDTVNDMGHAQMRFPSGKSFAELVSDDLVILRMREDKNETDGSEKPVSGV